MVLLIPKTNIEALNIDTVERAIVFAALCLDFYKINPHFILTDKGGQRSDFGIHLDGNVPGSMGCIVMSKDRFRNFESEMSNLNGQGMNEIPLFVQ